MKEYKKTCAYYDPRLGYERFSKLLQQLSTYEGHTLFVSTARKQGRLKMLHEMYGVDTPSQRSCGKIKK